MATRVKLAGEERTRVISDLFQKCQPQKAETTTGVATRVQPHYRIQATEPNKAMFLLSLFADKGWGSRPCSRETIFMKWTQPIASQENCIPFLQTLWYTFGDNPKIKHFLRAFSLEAMWWNRQNLGSRVWTWVQMLAPSLLAMRPWVSDFISLSHSFLKQKTGKNIILKAYYEDW